MQYTESKTKGNKLGRLVSLDALRGFDMFWIIGARALAGGLAALKLPGAAAVSRQLSHSAWNGLTFYDLIFPLFVFMTGVSLVFSLQKRLERGDDRWSIIRHVLTRTALLFALGVVYNGGFGQGPLLESLRFAGVLQRIALVYCAASLLVVYTRPKTQAWTATGILVGYWLLMRFIPVPSYGAGVWTIQGNLAHYVDRLFLPGRLYYGDWDPEGLLTTIPAVATSLLGVLTGHWLRASVKPRGERVNDPERRALCLFLAGVGLALVGLAVSPAFPLNKKLWTSSFVLVSGGFSTALLALFHWLIDLKGWKRWSIPFVAVGMNSLFIYLAARFVPFARIVEWLVGGGLSSLFGRGQTLFEALAQLSLEGLVVLWLYERKRFIRI
ncbi:MAG: acyltransferase family protein [Methanocella sp.]